MNKIYLSLYAVPDWISPEFYRSLTAKEQDYVLLRYSAKMDQADIKRSLYFNSKSWYLKFRNQVHEKIKSVHWVDNM